MTNSDCSRAIRLYLFGDDKPYPKQAPEAVRQAFDASTGDHLTAYAAAVVAEMDDFQIDWHTHDLQSATARYRETAAARHPELNEDALNALAAAYSYWWR